MIKKIRINGHVKSFKLKSKLITYLAFFIGISAVSFYFFFTSKFEAQAIKSLDEKASFVSQYIADELLPNLPGTNKTPFDKKISNVTKKYKIEYLVLTNSEGLVDKAYNLNKAEKNFYVITKGKEQLTEDNNIFKVTAPVTLDDFKVGQAYVGFSAGEYEENISSVKKEAGIISVIIFLGGTFTVYLLSRFTMGPVEEIVEGAEHYINGNLQHKINYVKDNQLGVISRALNLLSLNLSNADEQVKDLNRQLRVLSRDKIGQLNLEINQRRLAEHSLKQSEKQFRLLFEKAPIGMVISSHDDKILKVNNAFCKSLGYPEEELLHKKISGLTSIGDRSKHSRLHKRLLEENLSHIYFENKFTRRDGEIIYTIVESVIVRSDDEKPHHFISQVIDITERKKVEKELVKAKEKAEESDRLKTAFLAQMSHEIRTPLNVILVAAPLLADELPEDDNENKILLDSITNAGKRLQRTIELILNMSSVQSGNYIPEAEEINLEEELQKQIEEFKSFVSNKSQVLNFENRTSNSVIMADKYTVNQIFQNLIGNAIKYTPKGEICISVYEKDDFNISIEVKDTGIGMSPEYMNKLFTPFSQEVTGYKREFDGNGLGLALVKKYVELNKAEISVKSIKEVGSIFTVTFKNMEWHRYQSEKLVSEEVS
jgi:PAS domain S-box-containing protein